MKRKTTSHESAAKAALRDENRRNIIREVRTMADIANKRLRALEKADLTIASNAYRYVEKRHFDKDSAIAETRQGQIKFDTALSKKSMQKLLHEKRELERFLYEAKTSTVSGAKSRYNRAFETWKKTNPDSTVTRKDFDRIASTAGFAAFVANFGSSNIKPLMEKVKDVPQEQIEKAMAELTPDMTINEFYKSAGVPADWLYNDGDEFIDYSDWNDDEDWF